MTSLLVVEGAMVHPCPHLTWEAVEEEEWEAQALLSVGVGEDEVVHLGEVVVVVVTEVGKALEEEEGVVVAEGVDLVVEVSMFVVFKSSSFYCCDNHKQVVKMPIYVQGELNPGKQ